MSSYSKNAVSVGEKWLPYQKAESEHHFIVHSVFDKVINLSTVNCDLLSVTASGIGKASGFLSLPCKSLDLGVTAGEKCSSQAGRLILGASSINFSEAPVWKGPINKEYRHKSIKSENVAAFKAVLDRLAPPESAWRYISNGYAGSVGYSGSAYNTAAKGSSGPGGSFAGLTSIKDLHKDPALLRNLIGLGMGLTPAGDDMILGFLAVINHTCENTKYIDKLHNAVSSSIKKTVDISGKVLANALDCDYHEVLQNCLRDLCEGEREDIYISAASLLSLGASSGLDIATGMYFGMWVD